MRKTTLKLKTDASYVSLTAMLNQGGRFVVYWSRTLNSSEQNHFPVEKEANMILEAIRQ